jgi:hypothetical protein
MSEEERKYLVRLLNGDATAEEAETWIAEVVAQLGPDVDPSAFCEIYDKEQPSQDAAMLRQGFCAARNILGNDRVGDLVYREALRWIFENERDAWQTGTNRRPASQPPARWWMVERAPDTLHLLLEDERGIWMEWEPATGRLHNDCPWYYTDYYYRVGAVRDRLVESSDFAAMRFCQISRDQARRLMDSGRVSGERQLRRLRLGDSNSVDPTAYL